VENCKALPGSGKVRWTNVTVEVNGEVVKGAQWVAKQENPVCGSKAVFLPPNTIDIEWNAPAQP